MATKTARRPKGSGSLFQRCEARLGCPSLVDGPPHPRTGKPTRVRPKHTCRGMWVAVLEIPGSGERRRKPIVRAKKADAIKALNEARKRLDRVGDISGTTPTLNAWVEEWWEKYAPDNIKVTQWHKYRTYFALYILPVLGRKRLDQIDVAAVEEMQRYIVGPKSKGGLGLTATTSIGAQRILSSVLGYAMVREKIHRNVALIARPSKSGPKKKSNQLDFDEALRVLEVHDPGDGSVPQILAMLACALYVGPRPSELIGMTTDTFDLERGEMEISWQLQRIVGLHGCGEQDSAGNWPCGMKKAGYCPKRVIEIPEHTEARHVEGSLWLVRPKTATSWRRFPMPPQLVEMMRIFLADLQPGIEGLVFHRPRGGKGRGAGVGRPISLEEWNRRWHAALEAAGIERDGAMPTPHSARKTCNTILRDLKVPTDVRILILGHAGEDVNEDIYTSTSDKRAHEAMQQMGAAMMRRALG